MFALLEWCMSMPLEQLKEHDRATLLKNNFKLITHICLTFGKSTAAAGTTSAESVDACEHIHLSARFIITHLLNHLNFFPYGPAGPAKVVSSVNELSDLGVNFDELSTNLYEQPNVQFFTVNNQFLVSFVELPMTQAYERLFNVSTERLKKSSSICRFVVRDFCGKVCWDCCLLNSPDHTLPNVYFLGNFYFNILFKLTEISFYNVWVNIYNQKIFKIGYICFMFKIYSRNLKRILKLLYY
jgi:hypothetical protein